MSSDFIRLKFIDKYGKTKYIEFVLSLYDYFPRRDTLFFWQEKLINDLSNELGFKKIDIEKVYKTFNFCPLHDIELLKDNIPIVNGNNYKDPFDLTLRKQLFPLANTNAPRNLDQFSYPNTIDVFYCPTCRQIQIVKLNETEK